MLRAALITVSSTRTLENDLSGDAAESVLAAAGFEVIARSMVKDDAEELESRLREYSDGLDADLIVTSGGTGLGPFDITPEATVKVCSRMVPGIPELIRLRGAAETDRAALSRGVCGVRGSSLIINLPGSPSGCRRSLEAVIGLIEHAADMMRGKGH